MKENINYSQNTDNNIHEYMWVHLLNICNMYDTTALFIKSMPHGKVFINIHTPLLVIIVPLHVIHIFGKCSSSSISLR